MKDLFFYLFLISSLPLLAQTTVAESYEVSSRALFFAVSEYNSSALTELPQPIEDARRIAEILEVKFGYTTEIVVNPSFEEIENKLQEYREYYNNGDFSAKGQLLVYFSGHGLTYQQNGYFLPADADTDRLYATGLAYNIWRPFINGINCQHILVAIDACYSVAFDPNWQMRGGGVGSRFGRKNELSDTDKVLNNFTLYPSRLFFTSDAREDVTPGRSNFARKFFDGLNAAPSHGSHLSATQLFSNYVKYAQPTPNSGDFGIDDPRSGFFFFLQKNEIQQQHAITEKEAWLIAQEEHTISGYEYFLRTHPNSEFVVLAQKNLAALLFERDEFLAWERAKRQQTISGFQAFVDQFPDSPYVPLAKSYLGDLKGLNTESTRPVSIAVPRPSLRSISQVRFQMGDKYGDTDARPAKMVNINPFAIALTEVTFREFDLFCEQTNRKKPNDEGWGRNNRPVINVSWFDAIAYCNWLSEQHGLNLAYDVSSLPIKKNTNANGYRLPTEAEWEYAASYTDRGKKALFGNGFDEARPTKMNFDASSSYKEPYSEIGVSRKETVETGSLGNANGLGLYDMSGNVREWCWDWYGSSYYQQMPNDNPNGPDRGSKKVVRGGSYDKGPALLRTHVRGSWSPKSRSNNLGFRLAQSR